jgi:hypothetical protein
VTALRRVFADAPAVLLLRWALAVVLGGQAAVLLADALRATRVHPLLVALAAAEVLACVLLVVPRARRGGALLLAATLLFASLLHVSQGESPPAAFVVYLAAILVVAHGAPRG